MPMRCFLAFSRVPVGRVTTGGLNGMRRAYAVSNTVRGGNSGLSATDGTRGLDHADYHTYKFGSLGSHSLASYNGANLRSDLQSVVKGSRIGTATLSDECHDSRSESATALR
jgi:hypothetical protein